MSLSAVAAFLTILMSRWPMNAHSSPGPLQVPGMDNQQIRAPDEAASPVYINSLLSDITDAFRFLEEQPAPERPNRDRPLQAQQHIRKKEKISRLPFTQHNFIRFGKRFASDQDISSNPLSESRVPASDRNEVKPLVDIWARLQDLQSNKKSSEKTFNPEEARFWESPGKRQLHKFVRIGKRYPDTEEQVDDDTISDADAQEIADKRQQHRFIRFGKRQPNTESKADSVQSLGDSPGEVRKRKHKFMRIGKRSLDKENGEGILSEVMGHQRLNDKQTHSNVIQSLA